MQNSRQGWAHSLYPISKWYIHGWCWTSSAQLLNLTEANLCHLLPTVSLSPSKKSFALEHTRKTTADGHLTLNTVHMCKVSVNRSSRHICIACINKSQSCRVKKHVSAVMWTNIYVLLFSQSSKLHKQCLCFTFLTFDLHSLSTCSFRRQCDPCCFPFMNSVKSDGVLVQTTPPPPIKLLT